MLIRPTPAGNQSHVLSARCSTTGKKDFHSSLVLKCFRSQEEEKQTLDDERFFFCFTFNNTEHEANSLFFSSSLLFAPVNFSVYRQNTKLALFFFYLRHIFNLRGHVISPKISPGTNYDAASKIHFVFCLSGQLAAFCSLSQ